MKNKLLLALLTVLVGVTVISAAEIQIIPEDSDTDLYYSEAVYLRNLEYPEDLSATEGSSTAEVSGTGAIIIGDKLAGFPRVALPGGTVVTSSRIYPEGHSSPWWDGKMTVPGRMFSPSKYSVGFANPGAHRDSNIKLQGAYQLGLSNEWFSFSNEVQALFSLKIADGIKVWMATDVDVDGGNYAYEAEDADYCVTVDGICALSVIDSVNQIVLFSNSYDHCPVERVENGSYGSLPECAVICDNGYALDYTDLSCVRPDQLENAVDFAADYGHMTGGIVARQGYFRYRDSRGTENDVAEPAEPAITVAEKSIWEAIKTLDFNLWREANRTETGTTRSAEATNGEGDDGAMMNEADAGEAMGGILPRTGPGVFLALIIAGAAFMLLAVRRR